MNEGARVSDDCANENLGMDEQGLVATVPMRYLK